MEKWVCDFICASAAGIVGTFIGHPLDTIKCRLQALSQENHSLFKTITRTFKQEGFFGFFKGVGAPILNQFPLNALCFSEYYRMSQIITTNYPKLNKQFNYFFSGCWSGFVSIVFLTPTELVKCIQQLECKEYLKTSVVLKDIIQAKGLIGIFRGYWVTFNRDVTGYGLYFYSYYALRDYGEKHKLLNSVFLLTIGGLSGVFSWVCVYPLDTMKTLIQVQSLNDKTMTQKKAFDYIYHQTGFNGFFKGLSSCVVRAFVVNAVIFYSNEVMHELLDPCFNLI